MLILHRKRAGIKQERARPLEKEEVCSEIMHWQNKKGILVSVTFYCKKNIHEPHFEMFRWQPRK